ncbi:FliM/FliN family flagellar motor switch protein [Aliiroseovarius sp. S253]|uniref:FliM/FliN family flagellar motor switch protein n=1 Tax=Aliiroseovarius sp. S253 TaxID=3415133 RepID=UPI003C7CBB83
MADPETLSVLQRKAGAGRPPSGISPLTATGALGNALQRAAQDVAKISTAMRSSVEGKAVLDAVLDELPEQALLCLVEGPDSGFGMVILDGALMVGLVEALTIGKVSNALVPGDRSPTRTDAAICADFVDRLLECFEAEVQDAQLEIAAQVTGYRYALPFMDPQLIPLTLENVMYRTYRAELDLAGGAKQGALTLILPFDPPAKTKRDAAVEGGTTDATLADVAMTCQAELRAILHQVHLPVTDVAKLEVGMMIPVPAQALGHVDLLDPKGDIVTTCRLGQIHGQRALRIGTAVPVDMSPALPMASVDTAMSTTSLSSTAPDLPVVGGDLQNS